MSVQPRPTGVGIVYSQDGWPRISPEWARALTPPQRAWVDDDLAKHGFRMTADYGVVELEFTDNDP